MTTPEERLDAAIKSVLDAGGVYDCFPPDWDAMRKAMRKIMSDNYIQGSKDYHKAYQEMEKITKTPKSKRTPPPKNDGSKWGNPKFGC